MMTVQIVFLIITIISFLSLVSLTAYIAYSIGYDKGWDKGYDANKPIDDDYLNNASWTATYKYRTYGYVAKRQPNGKWKIEEAGGIAMTKKCPLKNGVGEYCMEERCAWWVETQGIKGCALYVLAMGGA